MPADGPIPTRQHLVTLDLEGVLTPEVWVAVADASGIAELRRTTRDEPDYDALMTGRLALLRQHGLTMSRITDVIASLSVLAGAREFLDELRAAVQVVILSDTFEQFAAPFLRQLGMPTILCHRLVVVDDRVVDYRLRQPDQKRHAVEAFRGLNYRVIAAGDSYNDASMLGAADVGFWFSAPDSIAAQFPEFRPTTSYDGLFSAIVDAMSIFAA
jgi:phosphoserine/homoserine phosphotransferase